MKVDAEIKALSHFLVVVQEYTQGLAEKLRFKEVMQK